VPKELQVLVCAVRAGLKRTFPVAKGSITSNGSVICPCSFYTWSSEYTHCLDIRKSGCVLYYRIPLLIEVAERGIKIDQERNEKTIVAIDGVKDGSSTYVVPNLFICLALQDPLEWT